MLHRRAVSGAGLGIPSPSVRATLQPGTELDTEWVTRRHAARSRPGLELGERWWGRGWEDTRPGAGHSPALGDIQNDLKVSDLRSGPGPSLHGARRGPRTGWREAPPPGLEVCPSRQGLVRVGGWPQGTPMRSPPWRAVTWTAEGAGAALAARMLLEALGRPGPLALTCCRLTQT